MSNPLAFFGENFPRDFIFLIVLLTVGLAFAGCAKSAGAERRYPLKGKVVSVDRAGMKVVIDHEEIPGLMPAMEMPFPIKEPDVLRSIDGGDEIQATLVVDDLGYRLEQPFITKALPGGVPASSAAGPTEPEPGVEVPDFKLVNQDGKPTKLRKSPGQAVLLTFIFTRCPQPDYCPLISTNFAEVNRELEKDSTLRDRVRLLSVTIDPAYDTPKVLRSYGGGYTEQYGAETFERWEFATGEPEEIRRLANFFGLSYKEEKEQIVHSLRTALVGADGRLVKVYRGNEWKPAEVLRDLRSLPADGRARQAKAG